MNKYQELHPFVRRILHSLLLLRVAYKRRDSSLGALFAATQDPHPCSLVACRIPSLRVRITLGHSTWEPSGSFPTADYMDYMDHNGGKWWMLSKSSERAMIVETNLVVKVVLGLSVGGNYPVVRSLPLLSRPRSLPLCDQYYCVYPTKPCWYLARVLRPINDNIDRMRTELSKVTPLSSVGMIEGWNCCGAGEISSLSLKIIRRQGDTFLRSTLQPQVTSKSHDCSFFGYHVQQ